MVGSGEKEEEKEKENGKGKDTSPYGPHFPALLQSSLLFVEGRGEKERERGGDVVPANLAMQWSEGEKEERLIGSRGLKMGAKKKKGEEGKYRSGVCDGEMWGKVGERIKRWEEWVEGGEKGEGNKEKKEDGKEDDCLVGAIKQIKQTKCVEYLQARNIFLSSPPFCHWLSKNEK